MTKSANPFRYFTYSPENAVAEWRSLAALGKPGPALTAPTADPLGLD